MIEPVRIDCPKVVVVQGFHPPPAVTGGSVRAERARLERWRLACLLTSIVALKTLSSARPLRAQDGQRDAAPDRCERHPGRRKSKTAGATVQNRDERATL